MASLEWRASLPPFRTQALPVFRQSEKMSAVTLGRASQTMPTTPNGTRTLRRVMPLGRCEGESWIQRDRLEGVLAHTFSPEFRQVLREHARLPEELNAALRGRMAEKFHIFYVLPQRRKSLMERAAACGALEMVTSFAENLEFTAAGVNKGTAVQALSARLGLGPEQVMAFGDAGNDLELLAWAGWSFAMANASAEAKKAARYETGSNAEGGVGMAVERWLLAE